MGEEHDNTAPHFSNDPGIQNALEHAYREEQREAREKKSKKGKKSKSSSPAPVSPAKPTVKKRKTSSKRMWMDVEDETYKKARIAKKKTYSSCTCIDKKTGKVSKMVTLDGGYKVLASSCECIRIEGKNVKKLGKLPSGKKGSKSSSPHPRPTPVIKYSITGIDIMGYVYGAGKIKVTVYRTREANGRGARKSAFTKDYTLPNSGDTKNFHLRGPTRTSTWRGYVLDAKNINH